MNELTALYEKARADYRRTMEEESERQKALQRKTFSMFTGPPGSQQDRGERMFRAAYACVKNNREYAIDAVTLREGRALAVTAEKAGKNLVSVMEQLFAVDPTVTTERITKDADGNEKHEEIRQEVPGWCWLQDRTMKVEVCDGKRIRIAAEMAGQIEELPTDKITGARARNPFVEPHDLESQLMFKQADPRLAKWLHDCAANGGQPTMAMLAKLDSEKIDGERLSKLEFGEAEWKANRLRKDSGATLTQQGEFIKSLGGDKSLLTKFYRREAALGVPSLCYGNHTLRNLIAKRDQKLCDIWKAAGELDKQWQAEAKEEAAA